MRVIAKLDIKPPYVVKPVHFEGLRRIGEPAALAKHYYDQGADEIFYIDIVASLYQRDIFFDLIEETAKDIFVPFAVGGGIRNLSDMSRLFHCGADKVVINTHVLQHDPSLIDQAARIFGSQSVVVNVEAKYWGRWWECYTDGGRERTGRDVLSWVKEAQERGAGELLIQSVDHDGRCDGFDLELIHQVRGCVDIPVVAASGAGSLEHIIAMAKEERPDAIAVASVLHYNKTDISEIRSTINASE